MAALAEAVDPEQPETLRALVRTRLQAQEALQIPELGRKPLTVAEAAGLARAIKSGDPQSQVTAMTELVQEVQAVYGPFADEVLSQVLEVRGVDRELARYGAILFQDLANQERPSAQSQRQADLGRETGAAQRAFGARVDPSTDPIPSHGAIQLLLNQPELAPQFDQKFGDGAAARILDARPADPYRRKVDGGTEFVDDTGEGFIPDE